MQLVFSAPVSRLSLGQVSYNLLREMWRRDYDVGFFPIGKTDLAPFQPHQDFVKWLQKSVDQRFKILNRDVASYKLWHINGSENLFGPNQQLITFYECNSPTDAEKSIVNLQKKTWMCGQFSENVFRNNGISNVGSYNLGFDEDIKPSGKKYLEGRTSWGLVQKFERRKNTEKIINLWVKKYGNNPDHSLTLCVHNPFFSDEDNQKLLAAALDNKKWWNVSIIPPLGTNAEVVDLTNAIDIDLSGASFSESWNLPAFNSTCLGKWSIVTNYGGHKSWATSENSISLESEGMKECYDDWFFHKGQDFNQGSFCYYSDEALINAFERAESKVSAVNTDGLALGQNMTYSKTLNQILS
jgi:hypothetical protein